METLDLTGCWTAMITPFTAEGKIDYKGLEKNIGFQTSQGVSGLVPVGTTGESPTLSPVEHIVILSEVFSWAYKGTQLLAGCGSNSTDEAEEYLEAARQRGYQGALLVDCYYNGPSSLELRERYYGYLMRKFPELTIVPYIIPGRTGCALSPQDLAILARREPKNVRGVKEATGDFERMRLTRKLAPVNLEILSGDDDKTFAMMADLTIRASGVISVVSNIAPAAVQEMTQALLNGENERAQRFANALTPLFGVVTITTPRSEIIPDCPFKGAEMPFSDIQDKFRNPVPIKTIMKALGMPAGDCRPPLGRMTWQGVQKAREAVAQVWRDNSAILKPIEAFYNVDINKRLENDKIWQALAWTS